MVINEKWLELTGHSPERMNAMTVVAYTGAEISALTSTAIDGQVVYCYSTGSGYTQGHWYGFNGVLDIWIDLVAMPSAFDYFKDTALVGQIHIDRRAPSVGQFISTFSGTGTNVTDQNDGTNQYVKLETGTQTTGVARIDAAGLSIGWGFPVYFKCKFKTDATAVTGQIVNLGMGVDVAGVAATNNKQVGVQWCDGDSSFQIHSADGSAQSNFDTNYTVVNNKDYSIELLYTPGTNVQVQIDDGTTLSTFTKTTNIPSSGVSQGSDVMRIGICNNNGNTTERVLHMKGAYAIYNTINATWI